MDTTKFTISKIEAAESQLDTAIQLWFAENDPVSIHALAAAAYQIVHDLNTKAGGEELLLDAAMVKEEYRKQWINLIKAPSNFFKHADKDPDGTLEFMPSTSVMFMIFAGRGLRLLGRKRSELAQAFGLWLAFHETQFFKDDVQKQLKEKISEEDRQAVLETSKEKFLDMARRTLLHQEMKAAFKAASKSETDNT